MDIRNSTGSVSYQTVKSKSGEEVKFSKTFITTLDKIKVNQLNRDKITKHVLLLQDKIMNNGFIDTIKVFPMNDDETYDVAEGNHRAYALRELFYESKWPNIKIEVTVLPEPEYNPKLPESVIETIIDYNKDNKPWTMYDYVSRWAKIPSKKVFQRMLKDMQKYKKTATFDGISHVLVCSIYTGEKSSYKKVKDGSFSLKNSEYKDIILNYVFDWVARYGTSKRAGLFPTYLQNNVIWLWNKISKMKHKDFGSEVQRLDYFEKLMEHLSDYHEKSLETLQRLHKAKTKTEKLSHKNPLETDTALCWNQLDDQLELFFNKTFDFNEFDDLDINNIMKFAS